MLVAFIIVSITFYYLVPAGESIIDYIRRAIEELIGIFQ